MTLIEALQQARINYLRVIEAGDYSYETLCEEDMNDWLCFYMTIFHRPVLEELGDLYSNNRRRWDGNMYYRPLPAKYKTPSQNKQALLDRIELIDKLLKEIE